VHIRKHVKIGKNAVITVERTWWGKLTTLQKTWELY